MIVVADTSPINYLLQIDCLASTLPALYAHVLLPQAVLEELRDPMAPVVVRKWSERVPAWVSVHPSVFEQDGLQKLHAGERSVISLAVALKARTVLLDDLRARQAPSSLDGLQVVGTLGVLRDAHLNGTVNAEHAYRKLRATTNFFCASAVEEQFLASLTG